MADVTLSGFGDNIYAGSISADRIFYNDAVGFYDPKSVTNQNQLTNADRIRAMSDEELAVWHEQYCPNREDIDTKCQKESCEMCWLDWLKEVKYDY